MAKIMIVDDSVVLRMGVNRCLTAAGYDVIEAEDGDQAMTLSTTDHRINVFILDQNMPGISGIGLARRIRKLDIYQSIPILMLSTASSSKLIAGSREVGVMAWIVKPFADASLVEAINRVLPPGEGKHKRYG